MRVLKIVNVLILSLFFSCSLLKKEKGEETFSLLTTSQTYNLADKSGEFEFVTHSNFLKSKNRLISKYQVRTKDKEAKVLEQAVMISNPGRVKDITLTRPEISQYSVWFEGKKYFSEIKFNIKSKTLDIKLSSPEKQWNGESSVALPKDGVLFCYLGQLVECAAQTGFIKKSLKAQAGTMNFYLILEGYPYFQEQYLGVQNTPILPASFVYDGTNAKGEKRFSLNFSGQSIFYFINDKMTMSKKFWVSQGLNVTTN
ncbi:MAG: hypothetical protein OHK0056_00020 [Bacteriovoracaceae bacterium]